MKSSALAIKALLVFFISISVISGGAFLSFFHASSEGDNVALNWQTGDEVNLKNFVIERKPANGEFGEIAVLESKGDNSFYTFIDESAYKTNDALYNYRLKIIDNDNSVTYSAVVSVTHSVSSVKRTWGSIKALFR